MIAASRSLRTLTARTAGSALVGAALFLGSGPTSAQVQLFPAPGDDQTQSDASPAPPQAPSGMAVEDLGGIDAEAVGAIADPTDALPATLWANLSRRSIVALIDGLPARTGFPAARDLARRLLLSAGAVPPEDGETPVSVLRARIDALVRLGFADDAATLAAVGADALADPDGRIAIARAQLAADDLPGACGSAASTAGTGDVFWAKLLAFCQALAGQGDQASLAAQTLADTGVEDPLYFSLMDSIALGLPPEVRGEAAGPLHFAMLRAAKAPAPSGAEDPLIAQLAALQEGDLGAAEAAAQRGILSSEALAEKYLATRFKDSALETPLEVLDRVSPPAARALLFQVLQSYEIPALKAEAVAVALDRAADDGLTLAVAPVFAGPALTIPPSADLLWFAEDAARLFYTTGATDRARAWHQLLRDSALSDPVAAAGDARLWHLAMLSGETGAALGRSRQGWAEAIRDGAADPEAADGYLHFLAALTAAATGGDALDGDADLRAAAMTAPSEAGPGAGALTLQLLARAGGAGRAGETAALAIAALSAAPPRDLGPATVNAAVRALQAIGQLKDARRIAIEAAVLQAPSPAVE